MKLNRSVLVVVLSISLSSLVAPGVFFGAATAQTQDSGAALQRGFRTGYSDGYMAGYRDIIDSLTKDYLRHAEYTKADRGYNKDFGAVEDYRDGYQQGFEAGYDTGFEKRPFESTLPPDIKKRGAPVSGPQASTNTDPSSDISTAAPISTGTTQTDQQTVSASSINQTGQPPVIIIPRETELIVELQDDLNTEHSREGDKFTAKVTAPSEIAGATVEGRISKITRPGRIKRRAELVLSFDRIIIDENRWSNFSAMLTEVLPIKGDNVQRVDNEGTAIGQSSVKRDAVKVGGATGIGLVTGAIVGGPVGAAVGAGVGAAFGVGAVVVQRGHYIKLNRNQQLRVKTAYETQIR